ncbi:MULTISPECIES: c-type cytochrome [Roseobacteraceae]|uniref:Cytochrome c-556 n=3 Tax=Roseobacteraceae TaxID=2854170 RepID=A0A2R8BQT7_9RHOB|nr:MULTISPECIES: cytochrome c [Roseobacteraceae]MDT0684069.1 cytochrome c [Roseicyclus sp. F158]SEO09875.1 Cytochrome c556 [Palleronia pelagia]SPJ22532.1 Cytochrome c-556 [Palleronia abyssalis]
MKLKTILAASVATSIGIGAVAHTGATGIVLERMQAMSAMGDAVKSVTPIMKGEQNYDADTVRKAAAVFEEHAGTAMTELFPEDNANEKSYVKDAIWEDWDEFERIAMRLETLAQGLSKAADNGLADEEAAQADMGSMMGGDTASMMGGDASGMMGGGSAETTLAEMADMPADEVFSELSRTCSTCHTRFRLEKD